LLNEELAEVKKEYKLYLIECEKYIRPIKEEYILTITNKDNPSEVYSIDLENVMKNKMGAQQTGVQQAGTVAGAENVVDDTEKEKTEEPATNVEFDDTKKDVSQDVELSTDKEDIEKDTEDAEKEKEEAQDKEEEEGEDKEKEGEDKEGEEGEDEDKDKKKKKKKEEALKPDTNRLLDSDRRLRKKPFNKEADAHKTKVFLKKNESKQQMTKAKILKENVQLQDTVILDKQKGYVTGKMLNGDLIVQIQGSTKLAKPADVKVVNSKVETIKPPFKFDKETQKVLFEQFVRCGIYMNNTPIKINDCYVQYAQWKDSNDDEKLNVMIEGQVSMIDKRQVRILEEVNDFANPSAFIPGWIKDNETLREVLYNAIDYTHAKGDADMVRVIDTKQVVAFPKSAIITDAV
jgi:hypothetical protein